MAQPSSSDDLTDPTSLLKRISEYDEPAARQVCRIIERGTELYNQVDELEQELNERETEIERLKSALARREKRIEELERKASDGTVSHQKR